MRRHGGSNRKRKAADDGNGAGGKIACMDAESEVAELGAAQNATECTLTRIELVVEWHARNDCLSSTPGTASFDTETLLESIPFCKMLAIIRPAVVGVEIRS